MLLNVSGWPEKAARDEASASSCGFPPEADGRGPQEQSQLRAVVPRHPPEQARQMRTSHQDGQKCAHTGLKSVFILV